jgi:hypothetical protein
MNNRFVLKDAMLEKSLQNPDSIGDSLQGVAVGWGI